MSFMKVQKRAVCDSLGCALGGGMRSSCEIAEKSGDRISSQNGGTIIGTNHSGRPVTGAAFAPPDLHRYFDK